jgi:hypothetical protein
VRRGEGCIARSDKEKDTKKKIASLIHQSPPPAQAGFPRTKRIDNDNDHDRNQKQD